MARAIHAEAIFVNRSAIATMLRSGCAPTKLPEPYLPSLRLQQQESESVTRAVATRADQVWPVCGVLTLEPHVARVADMPAPRSVGKLLRFVR